MTEFVSYDSSASDKIANFAMSIDELRIEFQFPSRRSISRSGFLNKHFLFIYLYDINIHISRVSIQIL